MRICIINGSPRKGNTYKATQIFKEQMKKNGDVEFTEFFLPKDMPKFCCGCYNCFEKGEDKCPHAQYTQPIANAMREADGIILTSPVYVLAESGAMKAFLDHYGYMFMPHRPMEEMFSKVAMVISTTAGAGTGHAIKTISRSLNYWGIKRIQKCGLSIFALSWDEMKIKKQQKFEKILSQKANKFYKTVEKRKQLHSRIFTKFMFIVMKKMMAGYKDDHTDKVYWTQKGWISGTRRPL